MGVELEEEKVEEGVHHVKAAVVREVEEVGLLAWKKWVEPLVLEIPRVVQRKRV